MFRRAAIAAALVACSAGAASSAEGTRPHLFSREGRFRVMFRRDTEVPIRDAILQVYDPAEKRWVGDQLFVLWKEGQKESADADGYAVFRAEKEGAYHLRSVGMGEAGLVERASETDPASACDFVAVYDKTPPAVELVEPAGGETFAPGAEVRIVWTAEDRWPLAPDCAVIEFSSDGGNTWEEIAAGMPPAGRHTWRLPDGPAGGYRVRVSLADRSGNTGSDASSEFRLLAPAEEEVVEVIQPAGVPSEAPPEVEEPSPAARTPVVVPQPEQVGPEPLKRGDRAGAVRSYRKGVVYLLRGDYDEAAELLEEAVELDPTFLSARIDLSVAYASDGRFRKARTLLLRSAELFPQELAFRYNLGRLYYREGDFDSAVKELGAALALNPGHVESLWIIGDIHAKREQLESARHYWQEVIENAAPGNRWRRRAEVYLAASYAPGE